MKQVEELFQCPTNEQEVYSLVTRLWAAETIPLENVAAYIVLLMQNMRFYHGVLATDPTPAVKEYVKWELFRKQYEQDPDALHKQIAEWDKEEGVGAGSAKPSRGFNASGEVKQHLDTINEIGYVLLEKSFSPNMRLLKQSQALAARPGSIVFNSDLGLSQRTQHKIPEDETSYANHCTEFAKFWTSAFETKWGRNARGWVVLHCRAGCRAQEPHADFPLTGDLRRARVRTGRTLPLVALFGIEEGSSVNVWPGSHRNGLRDRIYPECVPVPPGAVDSVISRFM
jgi:hypothetical protein